mgnify:CR=1 FL=1
MSIVLRPHHLLCTQGYSGHGYSEAFVEHMNDVVHQLREVPGTKIQLTFSTERKYMATIIESGISGRRILCVKGAPEIVRTMCAPDGKDAQVAEQIGRAHV